MKILVTGDGGALYCKPEYTEYVKRIRYLGLDECGATGIDKATSGASRWWEYKLAMPSGRFTMNDIAAAIGSITQSFRRSWSRPNHGTESGYRARRELTTIDPD
ncbi:MAG: hypothetical protein EBX51_08120 [Acidimicrobiia bacterium]|nr:hypothetical protein [Acidimicrobiia bacterium]